MSASSAIRAALAGLGREPSAPRRIEVNGAFA
jgi:hypothetical protein